jgi:hypothetical protein
MAQLELNGINFPISPSFNTWQDLLDDLETHRISKGKAISAVYFDGMVVPNFKESEILNRALNTIGQITIEIVNMQDIIHQAIRDVEGFKKTIETSMIDIAEIYRRQQINEANTKLSELFQGVKMLVSLLKGLELSVLGQEVPSSSESVDKSVAELEPVLQGIIDAQNQQDWILLADIVEFELLSAISGFDKTIQELKLKSGIA